ncbi:MAG: hypothetical protein RIS94_3712 [Pseudomonadota bacterium]|jgi:two-component system response regulator FixJ
MLEIPIDQMIVHVVDDEEAVRRSLDFLLRSAGYKVMRWGDGESFLKGVDAALPACVLLDVRMPGIDGLEVHQRMKDRGLDFPVILLTGHGDIELAVRAMKSGALDFLVKPFDRAVLLEALAQARRQIVDRDARRERIDWANVQLGKLTDRENEVLDGLACGFPNKTIAYDLMISPRTVEVYRANIMSKLEVGTFADALRVAFAAGLGNEAQWRQSHKACSLPINFTLGSG